MKFARRRHRAPAGRWDDAIDLRESLHRPATRVSIVVTGRVSARIVDSLRVLPTLLAATGREVELLAPAGTARILRDAGIEAREIRGLIGRAQLWREAAVQATGDVLALVDADGTVDPAELPALLALRDRYRADGVLGSTAHPRAEWRQHRGRTGHLIRRRLDRVLARPGVGDCRVGMKVVRRDLVRAVGGQVRTHGILADVELVAVARRRGARFLEAPVTFHVNLRTRNGLLGDIPQVLGIGLRARHRPPALVAAAVPAAELVPAGRP